MRRRVLPLLVLPVSAAQAQTPFLPPDRVGAVLDEAAARGFVSDSVASAVGSCVAEDVPVSRTALVHVVVKGICRGRGGCGVFRGFSRPDSAVVPAPIPSWPDSLASLGLLRPPEVEAARLFNPFAAVADSVRLPPEAGLAVLEYVPQIVQQSESLHPTLLQADARRWVAAGLMTEAGQARFLEAAEAGQLSLGGGAAVPYLSVASPIGSALGPESSVEAPDPTRFRDAVAVLNRRLDRPLALSGVEVETEERTWDWEDEDGEPATYTVRTLVVDVDGRGYRRRGDSRFAPSTTGELLNQVLRDRGGDLRVGVALALEDPSEMTGRLFLVVLDEEQARALAPFPFSPGSPRDHLYETAKRLYQRDDLSETCEAVRLTTFDPFLEFEPVNWPGERPRFDDDALATDSVRAVVRALADAGLVRPALVDSVVATYFENGASVGDGGDLFYALPESVSWSFDWEATTYPPDYVDETERWAAITRGRWQPDSVFARQIEGDWIAYGFEVAGRTYRTSLELDSDWFDGAFLDLILRSVEETDPGGRFYWVHGDYGRVVFLTPDQARTLSTLPLFEEMAAVERE